MLVFPAKKVIMPEELLRLIKRERSFLDRTGIKIFAASSNGEALALHRKEKADLIVALLDSPGMSGEELCDRIRDDEEIRKVSIILACPDTEEGYERCLGCRANSFVKTPVNMALLLEEAHRLLNIARRTTCRVPLGIELSIEAGGMKFEGRTENISSSGMLFETDAALNEGDTIACTFSVPGSGRMTVDATVTRAEEGAKGKNLYGVSFVEAGEDVVTTIALYVRTHGCE